MDQALADTIDYVALRRLQNSYADIVTRRAFDELHQIFLPDIPVVVDTRTAAPIVMTGPAQVGSFIGTALQQWEFFEFVILNSVIELAADGDPDRATARMYMCEIRQNQAGHHDIVYGLYRDTHVRIDGKWWFARRDYSSLARPARDLDVFGLPF